MLIRLYRQRRWKASSQEGSVSTGAQLDTAAKFQCLVILSEVKPLRAVCRATANLSLCLLVQGRND
jgi:hypothetical protein